MPAYTPYHSLYLANRITLEGVSDDAFAKSLSTARVEMNPHQVDAALFALQPPIPRGAILADEVGLGKTIEASLVIAQRWAERKRRILLIVPASLRKQWMQELHDKFGLSSVILEAKTYRERIKRGELRPFEVENAIVVTSYEFGAMKADDLAKTNWDLVIFDEAHRLRNVYRKGASKRAKALRDALKDKFKLLLTATPLQNSLMELFGLVSVVDEKLFGDEASFKANYGGQRPGTPELLMLRERLKHICRRTLRKDVQEAGHINYTRRIPATFKFEPHDNEVRLYTALSDYLKRKDTIAFGEKPNQLVTLVVRKILGSSTFAVAQTLAAIIDRLKAMKRPEVEDLPDIDTADEIEEEWQAEDSSQSNGAEPPIDAAKLKTEIEELESYLALARSILDAPDVAKIVDTVATNFADFMIEIPEIVVLPAGDVTFSFRHFDLKNLDTIGSQPLSDEIMVENLRTGARTSIARNMAVVREDRPEDYIVVHLLDYDQVDYDANADLLYKLAGQIVDRLRSYLPDEEAIENVLLHQGKTLAQFIFRQMMADDHYVETPTKYRARVSKGFQVLDRINFKVADPKAVKDFRAQVVPVADTRRHVFGGFRRCLYPYQSFQSDEERRFAVLIDSDNEPNVLRWVKPGSKQFQIEYRRTERYEPDFVVETKAEKLIVEIKARKDLEDETVTAKAKAARTWIGHANAHAKTYGGKPWRYLMIPHDAMLANATLPGLMAKFSQREIFDEMVLA